MKRSNFRWVDIYFYSHPIDQSIRFIGSDRFGKEPLWLLNDKSFNKWIGTYKVDINIVDTVPIEEVDFWTQFYKDLFCQWGYSLIRNDFIKDADAKRVLDLLRIKTLIINDLHNEEYIENPTRLQGFSEFYHELNGLSSKCRDGFLMEISLLLHCLFINGIPWETCMQLSSYQIKNGYAMVGNTIVTFSERIIEFSKYNCGSNRRNLFIEIPKVCNKSHLKLFVTRYINALSTYFGYGGITNGEFLKDFGRLKYWESGSSFSTTMFLIRLFKCKDRLELLVKLRLIPHLR